MKNRKTLLGAVVCCGALMLAGLTPGANAQRGRRGGGGEGFSFRFLGPAAGNRVAAVAGVPGDPSTYYAGASSGGVWKTTDGGSNWRPIFDNQDVAAIGHDQLPAARDDPAIPQTRRWIMDVHRVVSEDLP